MPLETLESGGLIAVPWDPFRGSQEARAAKATQVLGWLTSHPFWFNAPMTTDELYAHTAKELTSGNHVIFEVWKGGEMVGLLCLSRVIHGVDGIAHFSFWGTSFFVGRHIVQNFLGWAFETFHLQRISMEVPANADRLLRVIRRQFNFRFEGEDDPHLGELAVALVKSRPKGIGSAGDVPAARQWLAKFGSRREKSHWTGSTYTDVYLLRLLREDYLRASPPRIDEATPLAESPHVARVEESHLLAVRPTGRAGPPGPTAPVPPVGIGERGQ